MTTNLKLRIASMIYGILLTIVTFYMGKYWSLSDLKHIYLSGLIFNLIVQVPIVFYAKKKRKKKATIDKKQLILFPALSWVSWVVFVVELIENRLDIW